MSYFSARTHEKAHKSCGVTFEISDSWSNNWIEKTQHYGLWNFRGNGKGRDWWYVLFGFYLFSFVLFRVFFGGGAFWFVFIFLVLFVSVFQATPNCFVVSVAIARDSSAVRRPFLQFAGNWKKNLSRRTAEASRTTFADNFRRQIIYQFSSNFFSNYFLVRVAQNMV